MRSLKLVAPPMIDLHLHVLPGIDDGATDLDEACRMCQLALDDGCEALIVTPHQRHDRWDNRDREPLEALLDQVREAFGSGLALHLGAEIRVDSELYSEIERRSGPPSRAPRRGLTSLAGSRYLLLELDRGGFSSDPVALTHELKVAGWVPIFAHPEQIRGLDDLESMESLAEAGALFQITGMSLTGDFGPRARSLCERYLDAGLVHFVASDAHGAGWRPPGLSRARETLARGWGEETAELLTRTHPAAVMADDPWEGP